jgi:hypothetical protein
MPDTEAQQVLEPIPVAKSPRKVTKQSRTFRDLMERYVDLQQRHDVYQRIIEFLEPYIEHDIGPTKKMETTSGYHTVINPDVIFEVQRELKKVKTSLLTELNTVNTTKF